MTKSMHDLTDQEIREKVYEIIMRYPHPDRCTKAQLADLRSLTAPYIAEAKLRITKQTGHKFNGRN